MSGRLKLLSEQLKIAILERNRLTALDIQPTEEDEEELKQSLKTLYKGIQALDGNGTEYRSDAFQDDIAFLRSEYRALKTLYKDETLDFEGQTVGIEHIIDPQSYRDDPTISRDSLLPIDRSRKSVRFTDTLIDSDVSNSDLLQMQSQIMQDQDSSLDTLSVSIGRQRELSMQISTELDEHGELIDDVTSSVDRSSGRLDQAKHRLTAFSKQVKGQSHLLTIFILIVVLVLLIAVL